MASGPEVVTAVREWIPNAVPSLKRTGSPSARSAYSGYASSSIRSYCTRAIEYGMVVSKFTTQQGGRFWDEYLVGRHSDARERT